jgi:hypothetical protein
MTPAEKHKQYQDDINTFFDSAIDKIEDLRNHAIEEGLYMAYRSPVFGQKSIGREGIKFSLDIDLLTPQRIEELTED